MDAVQEEEGQELLFVPAEQNAVFKTVSPLWAQEEPVHRRVELAREPISGIQPLRDMAPVS